MNYTKIDNEEVRIWLKNNLNEKRYIHSLGTAECAKKLAEKFGLNAEKAYLAGLLHDAAKCFPNEKSIEIIKNEHLNVDVAELSNFKTLHAPVSAFVAEKEFGVTDREILSAIRWHTLGKIEMSDFEKIIFLADKIEPFTRNKENSKKIYDLLEEDNGLNKALLECYKATIISLVNRDLKICNLTIDIYNNLQNILQTKEIKAYS